MELAEVHQPRMPLCLRLQTDRGPLEVETQVAWEAEAKRTSSLEGGILHGVTFARITPDHRQALRDLLLAQRRERRAGVRLPVDLAVMCQPRGEVAPPLRGRTGNLSRGGLLLRLAEVLSSGTVLEVTLRHQSGLVTAEGEVVWVDPGYRQTFGERIRHGVRFTAVGWPVSLALARLLSGLA